MKRSSRRARLERNPVSDLRNAVLQVAAAYGCSPDAVTISFQWSNGERTQAGDTWTVDVVTASGDRRRRADHSAVFADTLDAAVQKAIGYEKWHREQ